MITTLTKTKKKTENFALKLWMLFPAKKLMLQLLEVLPKSKF